jgi:hypothetical protein
MSQPPQPDQHPPRRSSSSQIRAYIRPQTTPDAVHDFTEHAHYLAAWRTARPSLERVVFPIGVYTYVKAKGEKEKEGEMRQFVAFGKKEREEVCEEKGNKEQPVYEGFMPGRHGRAPALVSNPPAPALACQLGV